MLRKLFITVTLFAMAGHTLAGAGCPGNKHKSRVVAKTTTADPAENNYDVKYLKFNINVSDTSVFVSGNVSTTAQVVTPSMSNYVFELDTTLTIDSATIDGVPVIAGGTGVVRSIALPSTLSAGTMFTAQVFYHGLPPGGGGDFFNGITHMVTGGGTNVVFTVSDPYVAMNWWPCKQSIDDKIDSVDMYVTTPAGVRDGSNGVLKDIDMVSNPGYWTHHWHTNYPIDYYLISIAVARYAEYKDYWHFTGSSDSILIQNFFTDTASFNPLYKPNFDSIGRFMDYFSQLYGRFPFWREKYGVCYTTLPGGMEHQTMTTIGVPNTYIIAHELCHQWFGDNVTYKTWGDVWLSEGFATFSEQEFLAHFWNAGAAKTHRANLLASALSNPCGKIYVDDTTTSDSLFYQVTVYNKAQAVVTMLKYIAPSDSVFFGALQTYQQTYGGGLASTADLKNVFETAYGHPLDTFFNEWIYGRGYPEYKIRWNQIGSNVYLRLVQIASCPSYTPLFSTPLEIQLHSATADTFIKIYNNMDTQYYQFTWDPTLSTVALNPDALTICKLLPPIAKDTSLGQGMVEPEQWHISPNPTHNYWQLDNAQPGIVLELCDINGKSLWRGKSVAGATMIPGNKLPPGNYVLKLDHSGYSKSIQLAHW